MQVMVTVLHPPSCELTSLMHRTFAQSQIRDYRYPLQCKLTSGEPGGEEVTFSWAQQIKGRPATDSLYTSEDTDMYRTLEAKDRDTLRSMDMTTVPPDQSILEAHTVPDTTYRSVAQWSLTQLQTLLLTLFSCQVSGTEQRGPGRMLHLTSARGKKVHGSHISTSV